MFVCKGLPLGGGRWLSGLDRANTFLPQLRYEERCTVNSQCTLQEKLLTETPPISCFVNLLAQEDRILTWVVTRYNLLYLYPLSHIFSVLSTYFDKRYKNNDKR